VLHSIPLSISEKDIRVYLRLGFSVDRAVVRLDVLADEGGIRSIGRAGL